jgi:GAF domain-containing protein
MAGWSDEDVALVTAITDQLAQTIESLRLLDETQRRAVRERLTREITDKMRRAVDIDDLMKTTIREMAATLGTSGTFVQLSAPPGLVSDVGENGMRPSADSTARPADGRE